jgi:hypothetical protein
MMMKAQISPINSYTDEDEAGEVKAEGPREHHETTHEVPGQPLHRPRPRYLQRHHQECYLDTNITYTIAISTTASKNIVTHQYFKMLSLKYPMSDK